MKFRGTKRGKEYLTTWYRCNRSGTFKSRGDGKRAMRQQGTSKIGGYCTAYIKAYTNNHDGTVKIESCLDQTGHGMKLSHTRMPDTLRKRIAGKLAKGVAMDTILDEIRNDTDEGISRAHLVERRGITNVKHQFNVDLMEKDSGDTQSVRYWVNELRKGDYDPILIHKAQGACGFHLPKSDFLLGIQTQYQMESMKKHGRKIICMDATHGTNQYDFLLVSILVVDDYGEGLPVAWLISNREDQPVLTPFIAAIEARTGPITTHIFMTDDSNIFYNSWISSFPKPAKKAPLCIAY